MSKREPLLKTEPGYDLDRLRDEYARRERRLAGSDIYSPFNPAHSFTSILDERIKQAMAHDMLRVVNKPGGIILWYDYWLNPTNRQTRGVAPAEIRDLFPGCTLTFRRITLAPPIARRLVPISRSAARLLEKLKLLNSHYLVAIRPKN